jgi:IclR family pca regulon transcriptional regulator
MAILARDARRAIAIVDQELELGLVSLAMPLFNARGEVVAAFNISGQVQRSSAKRWPTLLPRMRAMQTMLRPHDHE